MKQTPIGKKRPEVLSRLEGLKGLPGVPEEYIAFRMKLYGAQADALDRLAAIASSKDDESKPLRISPEEVTFDEGILASLLQEVAVALTKGNGAGNDVDRLFNASQTSPALLKNLARIAAFDKKPGALASMAGDLGISAEALSFFGRILAAPFITAAVGGRHAEVQAGEETSPGCPFCGSAPGLSVLSGRDGARTLFCSLCGQSWRFGRAKCPFCSNASVGILTDKENHSRWIENCDKCHNFIICVDERKITNGIVPLVEVTASLYLNILAEKYGYKRGIAYAAVG